MDALFMIMVVGLALSTIVVMMYVVLREKRDEEAVLHYRRSPWDEPLAPAEPMEAAEKTGNEAVSENESASEIEAGAPADHTPVIEEPAVEKPAEEKKPE